MNTRRRASAAQRPKTPESNPTPTKTTSSADSSPLSSAPTSLHSSPDSTAAPPKQPAELPPPKRKQSFDQSADDRREGACPPPSKKTKATSDVTTNDTGDDAPVAREPPKCPPAHVSSGGYGKTRSRPSDQASESAPTSPPKPTRGGGRGRGRGGRFANGTGRGRGKARDHGDRDDTPEPPTKKRLLTEEERSVIASLKARQQELKKFFHVVGTQQTDVLDLVASRDIAKLVRKPKAHKKGHEYGETTSDLLEAMEREKDLFLLRYDMDVKAAEKQRDMEKELIETRFAVSRHPFHHWC